MPKPTLDELHARLGTQPAQYIDDFCAERQGYPVPCVGCGKLVVVAYKIDAGQLAMEVNGGTRAQ